jgi:hypothetical protein
MMVVDSDMEYDQIRTLHRREQRFFPLLKIQYDALFVNLEVKFGRKS